MLENDTLTQTREPERARAVFAQEDLELIRVAIGHYLREVTDPATSVKYSNLYHRLGRIA